MESVVGISRAWKMGETHTPLPSCPGCVLRGAREVKAVGEPRITLIKKTLLKKTPPHVQSSTTVTGGLGRLQIISTFHSHSLGTFPHPRGHHCLHRSAGRSDVPSWPADSRTHERCPETSALPTAAGCGE